MSDDSRSQLRMPRSESRKGRAKKGQRPQARRGADAPTGWWQRWLGHRALWIGVMLVVGSILLLPDGLLFVPRVDQGEFASRDWVAPRDILVLDEAATAAERELARASVLPVYDYDPVLTRQQDDLLQRLFQRGRELAQAARAPAGRSDASGAQTSGADQEVDQQGVTEEERRSAARAEISELLGRELTDAQFDLFWRRAFDRELEERARGLVAALLRTGVVDDRDRLLENRLNGVTLRNLQTSEEKLRLDLYNYRGMPDGARDFLLTEIASWPGFERRDRVALAEFLIEGLAPNVYLNRSETSSRREAAAEDAEQVLRQIREGQVIVRKGDEIDAATAKILNGLGGVGQSFAAFLVPLSGNLLLLVGFVCLLHLGIESERTRRQLGRRTYGGVVLLALGGMLMVELSSVIAAALSQAFEAAPFDSARSYLYLVPFAAFALLVVLFFGRGLALVVGIGFAVLSGRLISPDDSWAMIYALSGSLAAVYSMDRLKERAAVTRAGVLIGIVNAVTVLALAAFRDLSGPPVASVAFDVLCGFVGGILVAAVVSFAVPILESLLSVTTDMKLIELSDTNLPLLRRLAFEAPGTFQHSLMVSNLAKVACEAIGENSVLAYTTGLYHDIGKVLRPQYFAENQVAENLHDKLTPSMSALILVNHVKDGVELALDHRLPQPILDAIQEHHGTRKLAYFYNRALEQQTGESAPVESDFRYPGPKPQTRVMGVLMLADGVEAASRVLRDPTRARIQAMVEELADDCLDDGQLDQTSLTLQDLRQVKDAFCRVLESIYHKRVEYPGFEFNKLQESGPLRVIDGAGS